MEGSIYVTGEQTVSAGLLAGCSDLSLIDRCYAVGTVQVRTENGSFENSSFAGGLIGYSQRSEIYNCGADVALDAYCKTANAEAGGITAMNAFGIIANSYATGTLTAATDPERGSTMLLSTSETDRSYMPPQREPESRFPDGTTAHR